MVIFQFIHLLAEIINLPDETNSITFLVELITTKAANGMATGETNEQKQKNYSLKLENLISMKKKNTEWNRGKMSFFFLLHLISNEYKKRRSTCDRNFILCT